MVSARIFNRTIKLDPNLLRNYAWLVSGSTGRLVLSLAYFVCVANALSVGDFGLFATASSAGVVIARVAGLGFVSPLYRAATVKPRLIGTYSAGLLAAFALSLPLVGLAAAIFYLLFFDGTMGLLAFAAIIVAESLFWRAVEVVMIVNNGLGRFNRAAILAIGSAAIRAGAAIAFAFAGSGSLLGWCLTYAAANALAAIVGYAAFYPRQRLRFRPALYLGRWRDSISVACAEIVFYLQSDLDKLLVLSLAGPQTAGVYAILMRLVDLTGLPIRSANTMIVQKVMRVPGWISSWSIRLGLEFAVALVSVAGIATIGLALHWYPTLLGRNVATAAPLVLMALLVPAFRNLVEYESELLYAARKTGLRAMILAVVGLLKAALLALLLSAVPQTNGWIAGLNGLFFVLWIVSAAATYTALDWRARPRRTKATGGLIRAPLPGE